MRSTLFLLSPARTDGERAGLLMRPEASFALAVQLRTTGAPLGDVFRFTSGLYFRGKLTYARTFASPPDGVPGVLVITSSRGLLPAETVVTRPVLREFSTVPVDAGVKAYREPLLRDARLLEEAIGDDCRLVFLGSVATSKYVEPLLEVFGERLLFPPRLRRPR